MRYVIALHEVEHNILSLSALDLNRHIFIFFVHYVGVVGSSPVQTILVISRNL